MPVPCPKWVCNCLSFCFSIITSSGGQADLGIRRCRLRSHVSDLLFTELGLWIGLEQVRHAFSSCFQNDFVDTNNIYLWWVGLQESKDICFSNREEKDFIMTQKYIWRSGRCCFAVDQQFWQHMTETDMWWQISFLKHFTDIFSWMVFHLF